MTVCKEYLAFNLNPEKFVSILDLGKTYNDDYLLGIVEKYQDYKEKDIVQVKSYQDYLCCNIGWDTIIDTLKLGDKYNLQSVKLAAFKFIKTTRNIFQNEKFFYLFDSHTKLMKEMFAHVQEYDNSENMKN